jgi:type VII secretion integral membrane protein EccD
VGATDDALVRGGTVDDERCRITVVGTRRRVDLAVPARAPLAEYMSTLTGLCGEQVDETLPAALSLALAGQRPIPLGSSLFEAEVMDGATLYLRDLLEGETDEPLIADIDELVEDASGRRARWTRRHFAFATPIIALAAIVASTAALVIGSPATPLSGLVAFALGSGLALVAGVAGRRRHHPLPAPLTLAVALAACPAMALAGYALPIARHGGGAALISVIAGTVVGAFMALLAAPGACTLTVQAFGLLILPLAVLLVVVGASAVEAAATAGVSALAVLSVAPTLAGRLAVMASRPRDSSADDGDFDELAGTVARSRRTLITVTLVASLVLAGCVVALAGSRDYYAAGLAACLSLAALVRSGHTNVPGAVGSVLVAGSAGLAATVIQVPGHLLATGPQAGPIAVCGIGVVVLCAGITMAARPATVPRRSPSWLSSLGALLSVLTMPLALGVFGVFEYLAGLGSHL